MNKSNSEEVPFVVTNRNTRFNTTRLIDETGRYHQAFIFSMALKRAQEVGLDLVCFSLPEDKEYALCKIIDFGKWRYHAAKTEKNRHKNDKKETKEVRFTPLIAENDLNHKINQTIDFIENNHDVVLQMKLKGRQKHYQKEAVVLMDNIVSRISNAREVSRKVDTGNIIIRVAKGTKQESKEPNLSLATEIK